jgi:hypothetical protein
VEADETNYFVSYLKKLGTGQKPPDKSIPDITPLTKSPPIMK